MAGPDIPDRRTLTDVVAEQELGGLDLRHFITNVYNFKPGIIFRDVTTLFEHPEAFRQAMGSIANVFREFEVDKVAGPEARGFTMAGALSIMLGVGIVAVRKQGRLPRETISQTYELEYGTDEIHIHKDSVRPGERVMIVDDLIALGGTAAATTDLVRTLEGEVVGAGFIVELNDLGGLQRLAEMGVDGMSLIKYSGA